MSTLQWELDTEEEIENNNETVDHHTDSLIATVMWVLLFMLIGSGSLYVYWLLTHCGATQLC